MNEVCSDWEAGPDYRWRPRPEPVFADSTRGSAIFAEQVIDRKWQRWAKTTKIGCSANQVYSHCRQCADIGGHHVLALQSSREGWQATSLLERCREHAGRGGHVVQRHVPG